MIANQIPSTSKKNGRIRTEAVWKINVRMKEIAAEMAPLLRAVKSDETNILNPASKKEKENNLNAWHVSSNNPASYPTKIPESTGASR